MFVRYLSTAVLVLALTGCVTPQNTIEVSSQRTALPASIRTVTEDTVIRDLFDPEAARFRDMMAYRLSNGDIAVCGAYNAVNRYGAYVGYQQLYLRWRSGPDGQVLKSIKFGSLAAYPCNDLAAGRPLVIGGD